jgi:branched-chain amino acid transport system permease protein
MNVGQQIINGLALGSGYACIALGWTILLGAARMVNFAHGQLYMLGAFVAWFVISRFGLPYVLAIPLAVLAVAALGAVLQLAMTRLVLQQNLTSLMIVTLGFGYLIQGGGALLFGGNPETLHSGLAQSQIRFASYWFSAQDALVLAVTLLLYALVWLAMNRSRFGATIRAVAEDPKLAQLFGIDAALVYLAIFVFESAAVALAAVLIAPRTPILTSMGFDEVIITFVVVVFGGIGSIGGALLASFGLGLFTAFFGALVSPAYTTAAAFALLLIVLVARPAGLVSR